MCGYSTGQHRSEGFEVISAKASIQSQLLADLGNRPLGPSFPVW